MNENLGETSFTDSMVKLNLSHEVVKCDVHLVDCAAMPVRAHDTDVGYDVKAISVEYVYEKRKWWQKLLHIEPRIKTIKCDTGVVLMPEKDYWWMAVANSRSAKMPFVLGNGCGIIDPDYRGTVRFIYNVLPYAEVSNNDIKEFFNCGRAIGQLIPMRRYNAALNEVEVKTETERGEGGFGSTEKKQ